MRGMYDFAETKYRALEALGVDQSTYSAIVVPSLLEKMPEQLRLTIRRGQNLHDWNLEEPLEALEREIELREEYVKNTRHARAPRDDFRRKPNLPSTTMHAGRGLNCVFCLGGHINTKIALK